MKKLILLSIAIAITSCEKKSTEVKDAVTQKVSNVTATKDLAYDTRQVIKDAAKLKELTPFTADSFTAWLPKTLEGMTLESSDFMEFVGIQGSAYYTNADQNKSLRFLVHDGAGEKGSSVYSTQATVGNVSKISSNENDEEIHGVFIRNGVPSMETYWKKENKTSVKTIKAKRYIVTATGVGMNQQELHETLEQLKFEKLK